MGSVYICAGGTGGHVFPAVAIFEKINISKKFITDERGMRFTVSGVNSKNLVLLKTIRCDLFSIFKALNNIFFVLLCFFRSKPTCMICFGGIVTVIPGIIAKLFGAKLIIHEQNTVMGRANRLLKIFADSVLLSYKNTKYAKDGEYAGMPVRSSFKPSVYQIGPKLVIAIIGGSQGTSFFTSMMQKVLEELDQAELDSIKIFHQSRVEDIRFLSSIYAKYGVEAVVKKFFSDIEHVYKETNLVIARAGSATLTEICLMKIPAILIPIKTSMDGHQYENAKYYADSGSCILLEESSNSHKEVADYLKKIIKNKELLIACHKNFASINQVKYGELILEKMNVT